MEIPKGKGWPKKQFLKKCKEVSGSFQSGGGKREEGGGVGGTNQKPLYKVIWIWIFS